MYITTHPIILSVLFFFFNDTPTTEIYTLSLHDALPISPACATVYHLAQPACPPLPLPAPDTHVTGPFFGRSEEHTSELQSRENLVCRLLLEKKKKIKQ